MGSFISLQKQWTYNNSNTNFNMHTQTHTYTQADSNESSFNFGGKKIRLTKNNSAYFAYIIWRSKTSNF